MRKHLAFLFMGLLLCSVSVGLMRNPSYQRADAATTKLEYDKDGKITLGSFPLNYDVARSDEVGNDSEKLEKYISGTDSTIELEDVYITTVDGNKYGFLAWATINTDGGSSVGSGTLSDGKTLIDAGGNRTGIFDYAPLKWIKLYEGSGYVDFISDCIVFRDRYHDSTANYVSFGASKICNDLNDGFFKIAFSSEDQTYLIGQDVDGFNGRLYVNLPDYDKINSSEPACSGPSDIAILNHISSEKSYKNAPYWTKNNDTSVRMPVRWVNKQFTNCLYTDSNIGVRPVIRISSDMLKAYGGGSTSEKEPFTLPSNGDPALVIGIITGALGVGALVGFLVFWSKKIKEEGFKTPGWYYAIMFVAVACCSISIITFSVKSNTGEGGSGGGGTTIKYGYYVQVSQYSGGGIAQVGYTAWLIKSDGTCSYCSPLKDNTGASDFAPDNYMTGTYKISGSKLIIEIPKQEIKNFGTVGGTNTYTIKSSDSFQNSVDTYRWVRGE